MIVTVDVSQDNFVAAVARHRTVNFVGDQSRQNAETTHVIDQSEVGLHQLAQYTLMSP